MNALHWISEYFHTDGRLCADCTFCKSWQESHGEHMSECLVLEDSQLCEDDCPAFQVQQEIWDDAIEADPDNWKD